ncbi:MAG TPA: haloacid dehalogenase type II [Bryobacteraceae bacterium]|nr:haloacid dehalogenase type II [Bryobacteraceae bacterium]
MPQKYRAFLFDAYGTLFDVHSVLLRAGTGLAGDLEALSQLWRQKQLEFTWLHALMDRYRDFAYITEAALRTALEQLRVNATEPQIGQLLDAYQFPAAFPDSKAALNAMRDFPRAILSNGTPAMLQAAVHKNGFDACFSHLISVDQVKTYKPSPKVYQLGPDILQLQAAEILFVSSNSWDAAGAKAFGYSVCWCNRSGRPMDQLGFAPDMMVSSLDQISSRL